MKVDSRAGRTALEEKGSAILKQWIARTLQSYADQTSRFLLDEKDPFRNPVGHALKEGLPVLFEELAGGMDAARITPALDSIVRIRAVQDFTASQAVAFVFLLKKIVHEELAGENLAALEERIDELALLAFDLFMKCREKIYEIKANEARRRVFVMERAQRA